MIVVAAIGQLDLLHQLYPLTQIPTCPVAATSPVVGLFHTVFDLPLHQDRAHGHLSQQSHPIQRGRQESPGAAGNFNELAHRPARGDPRHDKLACAGRWLGFRRQRGGFSLAAASKTSETFGWGLGIVFNGEIAGDDVLDYPVPHNNYTNLGTKRTGNAIGLDALWFPAGASAWRPYAGLGLYYDKRAEIAQSNVTGWLYKQQGKSALNMGGELGLQYRTSGGTLWGMGYHTIRGGFLSVGWAIP